MPFPAMLTLLVCSVVQNSWPKLFAEHSKGIQNLLTFFYLKTLVKASIALQHFVNLKSNSALLYNKGHNFLRGAFPQKC